VEGIHSGDDVKKSGNGNELGPIVSRGKRNLVHAQIHDAAENVQAACAKVTDKGQNLQQIAGILLVNFALHRQAQPEHGDHGNHEQGAANPALLDEVSRAGNEPRQGGRKN
jgi:hypothetical protein